MQPVKDLYDTQNKTQGRSLREKLFKEVELMLGGGMQDIEPDPEHYELAFNIALDRYRQSSNNAFQEAYIFFEIQPDRNQYTLAEGVMHIRRLYRRSLGGSTGGANFDPFAAGPAQAYLMRGGMGAPGDLVTYDLYAQRQELIGRMFGQEVLFDYQPATRVLTLHRRFTVKETMMIWSYLWRSEEQLLADHMSRVWLRDYTRARMKHMIGEAREMYTTLPAPGSPSLNGSALKSEALAEMELLDKELETSKDAYHGYGMIIG